MKVFMGIRVDEYLYKEIEKEASKRGISKSDVARYWLTIGYLLTRSGVKISIEELLYTLVPHIMDKVFDDQKE